jgi:succinate--hydroxymethylglutarate CoA-transferase
MVKEIDHATIGKLKVLNSPVKYSRSGPSIRSPPPLLGEHTRDVLHEVLGMDAAVVDKLIEDGVASVSSQAKS